MPKVYDVLVFLDQRGWRLTFQAGIIRRFVHHAFPGVQITVAGKPSDDFADDAFREILKLHGELKE